MKTKPKNVLVFNSKKILICVCASIYAASKFTKVGTGNISRACSGALISSGGLYFRFLTDNVQISISDLNSLKLEDYDRLSGIERPTYNTICMNRKNWKYQHRPVNAKVQSSCIHNCIYLVEVKAYGRSIYKYDCAKELESIPDLYMIQEQQQNSIATLENKLCKLGNVTNIPDTLLEFHAAVNSVSRVYLEDYR